jgi:hydroxyacylglutathione hydrolase
VQAAQRELVRIGIDRPVAQAVGGPVYWADGEEHLDSVERVDFREVARIREQDPSAVILDVRQHQEWEAGHVVGALHIPFYAVPDRVAEIPTDRPVYVTCGSGYRAAAVVSLLRRHGLGNLIHVDDDWTNAAHTSLPLTSEEAPEREVGWTWLESRATARTYQTTAHEVDERVHA